MIQVFRQIRQKFIRENKLNRYLLYAVGEIFLVVIGILIALQVNNWNEQNKRNLEIDQLMVALEKDLEANVQEATRVIDWHYERDSIIQLVLDRKVKREDYRENGLYRGIHINFNYPFIKVEYLHKALAQENLGTRYEHLLPQLKLYSNLIDTERKMEETIWNEVFAEIKQQENLSWYLLQTPEHWEQALDYYTSEPIFLNKVGIYQNNLIGNYNRRILARRNMGIGLLESLKEVRHRREGRPYEMNFTDDGLQPFDMVSCDHDTFPIQARKNSRNSFLLFNGSKASITLYSLDDQGNRIDRFDLAPGIFTTSYYIGLNNHYEGMGFEWVEGTDCVRRYIAVKDGYLMIDQ